MSSLSTGDFTAAEQARIVDRLDNETQDLAQIDASIASVTAIQAQVQEMDDANKRVQNSAIDAVVDALLAVITARDANEPASAPHSVKFIAPGASDGFPVSLPEMTVAGGKPSIPSYDSPFTGASVEEGDFGGGSGGWEVFRDDGLGGSEADPDQPDDGELGAGFTTARTEFNDFQTVRLNVDRGSFRLLTNLNAGLAADNALKTLISNRNAKYREIGFEESP